MGRKRTIDRDALMDGVESVARREGVSGLSIDALAKEVGISKSSVVYDCGSKAGLLAAQVEQSDVELLWKQIEAEPEVPTTVDLTARTVSVGSVTVPFQIDDYTAWRLSEGLDDIGLTLQHEDRIREFEAQRPAWLPTTLPART